MGHVIRPPIGVSAKQSAAEIALAAQRFNKADERWVEALKPA
jgi:hypothetical protein